METVTLSFGKDKTAIIKGIAITFMIILHCGGQAWFDTEIPAFTAHPALPRYFSVFKLCVGIFTFMVGYGYAFARKKDWHYSWLHIKKLLIPFWTIMFIFTLPVAYIHGEMGGVKLVLPNLFGINSELCWVSWFVAFFIYAMLVMPFCSRLIDRWPILGSLALMAGSYLIEAGIHSIPGWDKNDLTQRLLDCMVCTPGMLLGYLFAHEQWFVKVRVPRHWLSAVVAVVLMVLVLVLRYANIGLLPGFNMDFFYAPMFILAVLTLFNLYPLRPLAAVLTALGNASVWMWFFHALFFTHATRWFYQPIIMLSNSLWVVIPWTVLITYVCSWAIKEKLMRRAGC